MYCDAEMTHLNFDNVIALCSLCSVCVCVMGYTHCFKHFNKGHGSGVEVSCCFTDTPSFLQRGSQPVVVWEYLVGGETLSPGALENNTRYNQRET